MNVNIPEMRKVIADRQAEIEKFRRGFGSLIEINEKGHVVIAPGSEGKAQAIQGQTNGLKTINAKENERIDKISKLLLDTGMSEHQLEQDHNFAGRIPPAKQEIAQLEYQIKHGMLHGNVSPSQIQKYESKITANEKYIKQAEDIMDGIRKIYAEQRGD